MTATDNEVLLTAEEVAARLTLTRRQLAQLVKAGRVPPPVPCFRDGRAAPLWPAELIAAFVEGLTASPPPSAPAPTPRVGPVWAVLPDEPTSAEPGSEGKLRAMEGRAALRMALFNPEDRTAYRRRTPS